MLIEGEAAIDTSKLNRRIGGLKTRIILSIAFSALLVGCAAMPPPSCAKHHCDPSVDEQFKRNASWDARSPDEYEKLPAKN